MQDILWIAVTIAFFAASVAYVQFLRPYEVGKPSWTFNHSSCSSSAP